MKYFLDIFVKMEQERKTAYLSNALFHTEAISPVRTPRFKSLFCLSKEYLQSSSSLI